MENRLLKNLKTVTTCVIVLSIITLNLGFIPTVKAVETPTLTIDSQTALNGAIISVPISASNFANTVAGMDFSVQYDPALLTYNGLTQNAISGHGFLTTGTNVNSITINWFDSAALNSEK